MPLAWPSQQTLKAALHNPDYIDVARAFLYLADSRKVDMQTAVDRMSDELRARIKPKRGVNWSFLATFFLACARTHDRLYAEIDKLQLLAGSRPHHHLTGFDYDAADNHVRVCCYENGDQICPGCCAILADTAAIAVHTVDALDVMPTAHIVACPSCAEHNRRLAGASA